MIWVLILYSCMCFLTYISLFLASVAADAGKPQGKGKDKKGGKAKPGAAQPEHEVRG